MAPVEYTCPDIDSLKNDLEEAYKSVEYVKKQLHGLECILDDDDRFYGYISDISSELDALDSLLYWAPGALEDLRNSNSALREWGEQLENELNDLR